MPETNRSYRLRTHLLESGDWELTYGRGHDKITAYLRVGTIKKSFVVEAIGFDCNGWEGKRCELLARVAAECAEKWSALVDGRKTPPHPRTDRSLPMPSTYIIRATDLHGACTGQVEIFVTEWPDGAPLTLDNVRRAAALHLDLNWFALHFLAAPALAAYEQATATALWAQINRGGMKTTI